MRVDLAISLLALDGSVPGTYDWHTKSVMVTGPVSTDFTGWFGFAASSGAEIGTFVLRNFDATYYDCDNP